MRPQEHEMNLPLVFWWEGPDGSRVLVSRIWQGYDVGADRIRPTAEYGFPNELGHGVLFLGVGDHGGAVTKEQIRQVLEMQKAAEKDMTLPELRFSTMSGFFKAVESSQAFGSLPVIRGDLQHHARGCYSAYGEGKYLNRRAERWLVEAETLTLMAGVGSPYAGPDAAAFGEAWWKVLFCQFHDMMAGTSLYSDYQDVRDSVGSACDMAQAAKVTALERMARRVDTSAVEESALFLFNPLPWKRKVVVECYLDHNPSGKAEITHLKAKDGTAARIQLRPSESMTQFLLRMTAYVELPACGYRVFELAHGEAPKGVAYGERVKVSNTGFGIASLKAEDGKELLAAPVGLVAISDTGDTWAHDIRSFRQEMGRPQLEYAAVIEDGPVMRVTRHRAKWQSSEIVLDMVEYAGMDAIELRFTIDWHEHEQMLKLEIPTALRETRFFAKVPGAVLERKTNGEEEPYQDWGAVQGTLNGKEYSVALLNAQTYSYDCLDGLFRTVLIRSAPFARHNPAQVPHDDAHAWQDQGRQERRFWLVGGSGPWTGMDLDRKAEELQTPAEYVMDAGHAGMEGWEKSFVEVMPESVWVLAVKHAEDALGEVIVRVQERAGKKTAAMLKAAGWGVEETVELAPWEMKTLRIQPAKQGRARVQGVSLLEA
jgi:alpha-mannosidase